MVIDALDEASAPQELADRLLRPLLDQAPVSGLRLLVGTRWPLVRALGPRTVVIDLHDPAYLESRDLAGYVAQVLLAEQEPEATTPYRGRRELAEQVASAVARRATPTFLIARLVARSLVAADEVVDVSAVGWQERLPATVGHAFDAYLERFGTTSSACATCSSRWRGRRVPASPGNSYGRHWPAPYPVTTATATTISAGYSRPPTLLEDFARAAKTPHCPRPAPSTGTSNPSQPRCCA